MIFDIGGRLFGIITYALPIFWAGMLMQLILLCSYVGSPRVALPRLAATALWSDGILLIIDICSVAI